MKLNEFFGRSINIASPNRDKSNPEIDDDVFWFILDHDKLYKDYFFPIASKFKQAATHNVEDAINMLRPMVNKGCKEYHLAKHLQGHLGKCFPKEMRDQLCHRLLEYYSENIKKGKFKLG
jgi:hypothetical protein